MNHPIAGGNVAAKPLRRGLMIALLFVLIIGVVGLAGCGGSGPQAQVQTAYRHVSGEEAKAIIEQGDCILVDTRTEVPYDMGHIPGAILIPYDQVTSPQAQKLLPDKDQCIVLYCDYGGVSKNAAEDLAAAGYTNVVEFDGLEVWDGPLEEGSGK
ncbi:MAG: rhodanese-like domain-containing protein [Coriobacteriia bacterium]|nr:rhodanese-like domain-containing protein [Coriobacteriia bacterium]